LDFLPFVRHTDLVTFSHPKETRRADTKSCFEISTLEYAASAVIGYEGGFVDRLHTDIYLAR